MPILFRDRKTALDDSKNQPKETLWPEGVSVEEMARRLCDDHRFEVTLESLRLERDKTALFLENLSGPGVSSKKEATLSNRARRSIKRLCENGITNYIVSYGTDFGTLALLKIAKVTGVSHMEFFREMLTVPAVLCTGIGMLKNTQNVRKDILLDYIMREAFHNRFYNKLPMSLFYEATLGKAGNITENSVSTECESFIA